MKHMEMKFGSRLVSDLGSSEPKKEIRLAKWRVEFSLQDLVQCLILMGFLAASLG